MAILAIRARRDGRASDYFIFNRDYTCIDKIRHLLSNVDRYIYAKRQARFMEK